MDWFGFMYYLSGRMGCWIFDNLTVCSWYSEGWMEIKRRLLRAALFMVFFIFPLFQTMWLLCLLFAGFKVSCTEVWWKICCNMQKLLCQLIVLWILYGSVIHGCGCLKLYFLRRLFGMVRVRAFNEWTHHIIKNKIWNTDSLDMLGKANTILG